MGPRRGGHTSSSTYGLCSPHHTLRKRQTIPLFSPQYADRDDRGGRLAAILYTVVTGDSIVAALTNIIARALNTKA